jgi:hypothetical protein
LAKSTKRKIEDIKNRKPNTSKRENHNRGKHGCSRLHEIRAKKEQEQMIESTPKEKITIPTPKKDTFSNKLKGTLRKLWK